MEKEPLPREKEPLKVLEERVTSLERLDERVASLERRVARLEELVARPEDETKGTTASDRPASRPSTSGPVSQPSTSQPASLPPGPPGGHGAPPFVLELNEQLKEYATARDDALIVLGAWLLKRDGRLVTAATKLGELDPEKEPVAREDICTMVLPFASPQRVAILNALFKSALTAGGLAEATGLAGGQLYHHLKELVRAGLVTTAKRGLYELTPVGLTSFVTLALLSRQ